MCFIKIVTVSFGAPSYDFAENVGSAAIDVVLSQSHTDSISVDVRSQDESAIG